MDGYPEVEVNEESKERDKCPMQVEIARIIARDPPLRRASRDQRGSSNWRVDWAPSHQASWNGRGRSLH
jgi:hypothetical protein